MKHETFGQYMRHARSPAQLQHGIAVEHRQRINGQQNGYRSISEKELREQREASYVAPSKGYKPTHGGYPSN